MFVSRSFILVDSRMSGTLGDTMERHTFVLKSLDGEFLFSKSITTTIMSSSNKTMIGHVYVHNLIIMPHHNDFLLYMTFVKNLMNSLPKNVASLV